LFPLALGSVQLSPDPLQTAVMLQEVLALRGEARGNPDPACAWTGDLHGAWQVHTLPPFQWLRRRLEAAAGSYLEALGFTPERIALHLQRSWPVVSEVGQVVGRHHHPTAHLSAVYYLNGDGSGSHGFLRLYPHRQANELVPGLAVGHGGPIAPGHPLNASFHDVAPRAGLLVLFPASTEHAVTANLHSDDHRVSVSFDLQITAPVVHPGADPPPEYLAPHPSQWSPVPSPHE
jgi:uncharacterized protein (TIGR02466 family)